MYDKTIWAAGDVITAAKLNKIEDALDSIINGTTSKSVSAIVEEATSGSENNSEIETDDGGNKR